METYRKENLKKKTNDDYIINLYIRYITCLDCDYRERIFNPKDFKFQRCLNEQCRSNNTKFKDRRPDYFLDEIKCLGKFRCSCKNTWTSYATWIFFKQTCLHCSKKNHPVECQDLPQFGNKFGYGQTNKKSHDEKNCEFCLLIGKKCISLKSNDLRYFP